MIIKVWYPYRFFFYFLLTFSIILSISADNWFIIWLGLEVNLYSFIPLILLGKKNQEKEAAIKYFISQRIPSAILLVTFILLSDRILKFSSLLIITIIIKIGIVPTHFWLPSVIGGISWRMCWILSTIQKIAPIFIIFCRRRFSPLVRLYSAGLSSLVGGIGGLNQTIIRVILAYSSIGHIGWILAGSMTSFSRSFFYFLVYIVRVSSIFILLEDSKIRSINFRIKIKDSFIKPVIVRFLFLRLGGLPPFLGFFPKIIVISRLVDQRSLFVLVGFLVFGSILNLYYYLKIIFSRFLCIPSFFFIIKTTGYKLFSGFFGFFFVLGLFFILIILNIMLINFALILCNKS